MRRIPMRKNGFQTCVPLKPVFFRQPPVAKDGFLICH